MGFIVAVAMLFLFAMIKVDNKVSKIAYEQEVAKRKEDEGNMVRAFLTEYTDQSLEAELTETVLASLKTEEKRFAGMGYKDYKYMAAFSEDWEPAEMRRFKKIVNAFPSGTLLRDGEKIWMYPAAKRLAVAVLMVDRGRLPQKMVTDQCGTRYDFPRILSYTGNSIVDKHELYGWMLARMRQHHPNIKLCEDVGEFSWYVGSRPFSTKHWREVEPPEWALPI